MHEAHGITNAHVIGGQCTVDSSTLQWATRLRFGLLDETLINVRSAMSRMSSAYIADLLLLEF